MLGDCEEQDCDMQARIADADADIHRPPHPCAKESLSGPPALTPEAARNVQELVSGSKRSYVTRRLDLAAADRLIGGDYRPKAGDIAVCAVTELGRHEHLELVSGRRSKLFVGDRIIVAFGERYATDQYHAILPQGLSECALAAAGGIASKIVSRHSGVKRATHIQPIGVLAAARGEPLNISRGALAPRPANCAGSRPIVIAVFGASMNAGKTTAAANIIRSLKKQNAKVAAVKLTGTGSGGDCWLFKDAGADPVLDFTDAGFATTYNAPIAELEKAARLLFAELSAASPDFIVCEIADGLLQQETSALLMSPFLKETTDSVVFAAADPISAAAGVHILASHGYAPAAICGVIGASPLAAAEAEKATGLRVLTNAVFADPTGGAQAFLLPARPRRSAQ